MDTLPSRLLRFCMPPTASRLVRGGLLALFGMGLLSAPQAAAKEYTIGLQCDRSGFTQSIGPFYCQGFHDYLKLFNAQGQLPGHRVKAFEIDHGFDVNRGVESYNRFKQLGVVSIALYGTAHIKVLLQDLHQDRLPGTSPGFGDASSTDGKRYPYLFPAAATYWSQAAAAVKFVVEKQKALGKTPAETKIAYLYFDNPAGQEPLPLLGDLQRELGFTLRSFAVPAPGIDMRPQVIDIARRYRADWVLMHLFGRSPGVALKEFTRLDFPRERLIGFVWAGGEADIRVAGRANAEGYYTLQFAHVGSSRQNPNHPLLRALVEVYRQADEPLPRAMDESVYYNRGLMAGALHAHAIKAAVEAKGVDIRGEDVRNAMEVFRGFDLDGFMAPITMSPSDHEGGGYVRVYQVQESGFVPVTPFMRAYRATIARRVAESAASSSR